MTWPWTDPGGLAGGQYRTEANLVARQSIYSFQRPTIDLPATVLDLARLPLADGGADVCLAPHMLYHVPDPLAAIAELRRVTRPGGRVVVVLNGVGHLAELLELAERLIGSARAAGLAERPRLDEGEALLRSVFGVVERHDLTAESAMTSSAPVAGYLRSMIPVRELPDPDGAAAAAARAIRFGPDGVFRVRTHKWLPDRVLSLTGGQ